jgi:hypothetical protein
MKRTEIRKGDTIRDARGKHWIVQALNEDGTVRVSSKGNRTVLVTKTVKKEATNIDFRARQRGWTITSSPPS